MCEVCAVQDGHEVCRASWAGLFTVLQLHSRAIIFQQFRSPTILFPL